MSEKGLKKLAEGLKRCKDLLVDEDTLPHLQACLHRQKHLLLLTVLPDINAAPHVHHICSKEQRFMACRTDAPVNGTFINLQHQEVYFGMMIASLAAGGLTADVTCPLKLRDIDHASSMAC